MSGHWVKPAKLDACADKVQVQRVSIDLALKDIGLLRAKATGDVENSALAERAGRDGLSIRAGGHYGKVTHWPSGAAAGARNDRRLSAASGPGEGWRCISLTALPGWAVRRLLDRD